MQLILIYGKNKDFLGMCHIADAKVANRRGYGKLDLAENLFDFVKDWEHSIAIVHNEKQYDEIFVTNIDVDFFSEIGWETKRMGNFAFDDSGDILPDCIKPVFIKIAEAEKG